MHLTWRFCTLLLLGAALPAHAAQGAEDEVSQAPGAPAKLASLTELVPTLTPVPDYSGDFWDRYTLLGDFGGGRQRLYEGGVAFDATLTQVYQGVTAGGNDDQWEYNGLFEYGFSLDTGKLGWWPGGLFVTNIYTQFGDNLFADTGNIAPVNFNAAVPDTDPTSTFPMEYYLTQALPTKTLVTIGRLNPVNFLDRSRLANDPKSQYLNAAIDNNVMVGSFVSFSTYAVLAVQPITENFAVYGAVFDAGIQPDDYSAWNDFGGGVGADIEWEIGGLKGTLNPVFIYSNKDTAEVNNPYYPFNALTDIVLPINAPRKSDNYAVIATLDQYLWKPGGATKSGGPKPASDEAFQEPGLGLTVRAGIGPEERNPFDAYASVAIGGRGLIPGRPHDRLGIGAYALFLSAEYEDLLLVGAVLDDEVGVEAFYNFAITPALQLGLDVQWIDAGIQFTDDTWVFGTRLFTRF